MCSTRHFERKRWTTHFTMNYFSALACPLDARSAATSILKTNDAPFKLGAIIIICLIVLAHKLVLIER